MSVRFHCSFLAQNDRASVAGVDYARCKVARGEGIGPTEVEGARARPDGVGMSRFRDSAI